MHSRGRGKSSSKKPIKKTRLTWIRYDDKTIEQLVTKLAKAGHKPSAIGLILRDAYGIPDVKSLTTKSVAQILKENNMLTKLPEDMLALIQKDIEIMKHLELHKKDMPAKRGMILTESKIRRLAKYYKSHGRIPEDWTYDRTKAKLLIE